MIIILESMNLRCHDNIISDKSDVIITCINIFNGFVWGIAVVELI